MSVKYTLYPIPYTLYIDCRFFTLFLTARYFLSSIEDVFNASSIFSISFYNFANSAENGEAVASSDQFSFAQTRLSRGRRSSSFVADFRTVDTAKLCCPAAVAVFAHYSL